MLAQMLIVEIVLLLVLPVGLWFLLRRQPEVTWKVIGAGVLAFVASQAVHIPLVAGYQWLRSEVAIWPFAADSIGELLAHAAFVGLAAGISEEGARYVVLRYWLRKARTWIKGIAFGAGHGGVEAVLVGLLVLAGFVSMVAMREANLTALELSGAELEEAQAQIEAYWSAPWYLPLLGGLERVFGMSLQIALSLLVVRALARGNLGWLAAAVLGHAVADGLPAGLMAAGWSAVAVEGVVFLFALGAVAVILSLRSVSRETLNAG
ncbi:MAG: YhfC family glutamic-type intramembrane protease [Anaerolineae bacterium]|jgi:uncharacterized membrane protein YhfC